MSDLLKFQLPATFETTVYGISRDGIVAKATLSLPAGRFPTRENMADLLAETKADIEDQGFFLMTPQEFGSEIVFEQSGQRYAVPVSSEWETTPSPSPIADRLATALRNLVAVVGDKMLGCPPEAVTVALKAGDAALAEYDASKGE